MKARRQTVTRPPTPATTRAPHLVLQRTMSDARSLEKKEALATARVNEALDSPGQSLDAATRAEMESRLGHDFTNVRVHADATAANAARAVNARAYALGNDIVFGAGAYEPNTQAGKRLLAHELTHVVQQGDAEGTTTRRFANAGLSLSQPSDRAEQEASRSAEAITRGMSFAPRATMAPGTGAMIQRADDEWNKAYGTHKSFLQKPFEEFKAGLGEVKATTQGGLTENKGRPLAERQKGAPTGTPAAPEISFDTLKEIYDGLASDIAKDKAKDEKDTIKETKARAYLAHLNKAFKIMKIDTVEAQAVYLAHAYIESDQFRQFTETQGSINEGAQKWMDDPTQLQINKSDLKKRYALGGSVNPTGGFEFIGRGPVQVTHKAEYVEVIAMLEKTADQYQKDAKPGDAKAKEYADLARKAAKDIKADPRKAADPEYTFLVSAAFMKKRGADVSAATVKTGTPWTGADAASGWVAGGKQAAGSPQAKALVDKSNAFDRIYPILLREAKKKNPAVRPATATP